MRHKTTRGIGGRQHGFTFVELLVLMAIICILGAMLLPALQGMLLTARLASCVSNLRQFSAAFTMYSGDYNNHMPAPWNTGNGQCLRDMWYSSNPRLPMGLAVFYRDSYLADGNLVFCPDNMGGGISKRDEVLASLDSVRTTGKYTSISGGSGAGYIVNLADGSNNSMIQHTWSWANYIDFYAALGIASRVSGNLPGGRNHNAPNGRTARIRSPRPYMSCGFPNMYLYYTPHRLNSFNALYADGLIQRIRLDQAIYQNLRARSPNGGFRDVIVPSYPNYLPPR